MWVKSPRFSQWGLKKNPWEHNGDGVLEVKPKAEGMAEFCCFAAAPAKAPGWISWENLPRNIPSMGILLLGSLENGADPAALLHFYLLCASLSVGMLSAPYSSHFHQTINHLSQTCSKKKIKKKFKEL